MYALDFETEAIGDRPHAYPPEPVGLAWLNTETLESGYYAWGHGEGNTHSYEDAKTFLESVWGQEVLIFHNASFDLEVAQKHFGLPELSHQWFECTLILAYLQDPHAPSLALKDLAVEWLWMNVTERDEIRDWLLANVPEAKRKPSQWGAHISKAPVSLVRPYAIADVKITWELYGWLRDQPDLKSMDIHTLDFKERLPGDPTSYPPDKLTPYQREKACTQIMNRNSQQGLRLAMVPMSNKIYDGDEAIKQCDIWLRKRLNVDETVNLDSARQLVLALRLSDCWDRTQTWPQTPSGQYSSTQDTLQKMITDQELKNVLHYKSLMKTMLGTFIKPWYLSAQGLGRIYTSWYMTRNDQGGTRTGRMSSSPNFQNIPKEADAIELPEELANLCELPNPREFLLADEGHQLISADFSGQELRIFAHLTKGPLRERFNKDPHADMHAVAAELMQPQCSFKITRSLAKAVNFAIIYGAGAKKLGIMLGISPEEAAIAMSAYKDLVVPELEKLQRTLKDKYFKKKRIRTCGLRLIPMEPPVPIVHTTRFKNFDYKAINLLIQGGAADQTKQAVVDYDKVRHPQARIYLVIHDEIVISCPEAFVELEREKLVRVMENAIQLRVPVIAESKIGLTLADVK